MSKKVDYLLDCTGEPCPFPAIATKQAIKNLKAKEVLEVISDCPQSINSIPKDMSNLGFNCEVNQSGPILAFYIWKD
ncbi:sulfurtransferase-like selenium metabolism protein YedF [Campylobacter canadensis]|uniref:Sulfurtransferase-like selenium metabolism protein YedF n=1 Tax=Campylobacter canadensis TaxID=449520 RepID=A0ABS7WTK9_9BACT|nr:sulfurtransferase-like selenium metabolism protein YedF [Campylobacter canadensis]MBZ7987349.1 sulfurtransferase-like selenium metabolism protein YedF [Campylobacter canadensis]MBZ7994768.1 sulfurtransferase-like selenium metabolism protein YedF [Campylobacter canadensis]MBZ7996524.1 sulfurtransferase-like selenium metabolism protein YedF [Campylobacter canadensis]MBZ7998480.1 sulfurtransferase-like selenium metabolism protein YedF [Campylobacter canadensis]MBZ8000194.1 sulfurtransferase-li